MGRIQQQQQQGRIGKPQKSRKHKKIKAIDPFYTGNRIADRKSIGINQAPTAKETDDQEIPYTMREIMKLKEEAKSMKKTSRRQLKKDRQAKVAKERAEPVMEKGMTRPIKPVPEFKQGKKESNLSFINRIEHETQVVIAKAQFEDKYKVNLDETDCAVAKKKTKKSKKNTERLKEKKLKKKEQVIKKMENRGSGFEKLKDEVKFGDVVMAPPSLTAKPRKSKDIGGMKPGKRALLLKEIIQKNSIASGISVAKRKVGQTTKRKNLAPVQQHIMDQEREKAIQQYRDLKQQRLSAQGRS